MLDIFMVLDDSTDENGREVAAPVPFEALPRRSVCRSTMCIAPTRTGYKAGALARGLRFRDGWNFVAIFDGRFSSLRRIFCDARCRISPIPKSAWSRGRWTYLNRPLLRR